ncbi:hypothetical protein Aph02nite_82640 [Actinoplanes philippinensis]|uniref:Uncharacterized protein n=1 Tax=Actinoplanes philippinensis TaxID=35752 RepID=A0A1I2MM78_9ACTN|nr:hypothetical protein [Actinoplanes philippinensis]GIE82314.1 hypothetical protein Aph02nite_82640 [Actinoplanes philippinensis]SFF92178.1 hypothetical protein SAMN05421541_13122 [Actinoplanes philippinensis]
MGGFILGVVVAILVGMRLARLIDARKGARGDYKKADTGLPGARKKSRTAFFALVRFVALLVVIAAAVIYGFIRANAPT